MRRHNGGSTIAVLEITETFMRVCLLLNTKKKEEFYNFMHNYSQQKRMLPHFLPEPLFRNVVKGLASTRALKSEER